MVELPRGKVSETRRGGVGVLELLLVDMQKRSDTGYIRCEAGALGGAIGQITVRQGTPSMSLYEDAEGNVLVGHSALGALQEAASLEGSQLTRHHEIDLDRTTVTLGDAVTTLLGSAEVRDSMQSILKQRAWIDAAEVIARRMLAAASENSAAPV